MHLVGITPPGARIRRHGHVDVTARLYVKREERTLRDVCPDSVVAERRRSEDRHGSSCNEKYQLIEICGHIHVHIDIDTYT